MKDLNFCQNFIFRLLCLLMVSGPAIAQYPGPGNTLNFNGFNNFIHCGLNNRGVTDKITLEAWIKTSSQNYEWVAGKYSNTQGEEAGYHLFISGGKTAFNGRDGSDTYYSSGLSSTIISDNRWHHIAGIYSMGRWEIWVDGMLENHLNSGNTKGIISTRYAPFTIGNYYEFSSQYFTGNIDEVRVWKSVRTQDQIRANMCQKLSGNNPDLVSYYKFDHAAGNLLTDLSINALPGTLNNFLGQGSWIKSGAPIGDKSIFTYKNGTNNLNNLNITDATTGHFFEINSFSSSIKGIHLYEVKEAPNSFVGLESSNSFKNYFGVFSTSTSNAEYDVYYKGAGGCSELFYRPDNAMENWKSLTTVYKPSEVLLAKNSEKYRGEYILSDKNTLTVNISGKQNLCQAENTVLTATANNEAATFLWSTGARTSSINVNISGTYSVTATAPNGCEIKNSFIISEVSPPQLSILGPEFICEDGEIKLSASIGTEFLWSTGEKTKEITVKKPGKYSVKIKDSNGCNAESATTVNLNIGLQNFSLGKDTVICTGSSLVLGKQIAGAKYKWQDGSTDFNYPVKESGLYVVDILFNNCLTQSKIQVTVEDCQPFIPNIITPNGDRYNDFFEIKNVKIEEWEIRIFNRWGKLIFAAPRYNNEWEAKDCADGIYFYTLQKINNPNKTYKGFIEVIR